MCQWTLIAAVLSILGIEASSAQIPLRAQNRPAAHVDSLRRALKLSSDLRLDWLTSANGVDTLRVIDDFERSTIGPNWAYDPYYWQILDGELDVKATATNEWRYLAVFLPVFNDANRQIYSVSYRWGRHADELGIAEGSHALMIDQPHPKGSGYWLWHRTNWFAVWLWILKNGAWEYSPGKGKEVDTAPSGLGRNPEAGDVVTAYIRQRPEAVYFDYYMGHYWDATVKDTSKEFPKNQMWWTGVFIHGQELNNQIDDFTVTWLTSDVIGPAAVTDLRAVDSTTTSIDLEWTSPGDNGSEGKASRLELRYAPVPITADNFANATLASNLPPPAPASSKQRFKVTNLASNTVYYFAVKIFDELGNTSALSNVFKSKTRLAAVAAKLILLNGCGQTGVVDTNLLTSLAVRVTDNAGLGVSNHPVEYVIMSGNGAINGASRFTMNTDAAGEARATWKLGPTAGAQTAEIRATGLQGSPLSCIATATAGAPNKLSAVSGNGQIVSINQAAPQLLEALLADQFGNVIANQSVVFNITAGGGYFLNGQVPAGKNYQTLTDALGHAQARVAASNLYGDTTKIMAKWANSLAANFFVLAAKPDSTVIVSGNNQTAARRTVLPESLKVKILDTANSPVQNYPVAFRILSGEGTLAQNQTQIRVNTDGNGLAKTAWTLGHVVGVQQVEASALFNAKNLRNTPLVFTATAFVPTAVEEKVAAAPKQFALHQNFPNPFNPATMLRFDLPQTSSVTLAIYDLNGNLVQILADGPRHAGHHQIAWNGRNGEDQPLGSGIYFAVLRAGHFVLKQKMILAK